MNIVQIVSSNQISGTTSQLLVLANRLREREHRVLVICPPGGWLPDRVREAGMECREVVMHGPLSPFAVPRIVKAARAFHAHILHTHLTRAAYLGHIAGRLAGLPVVSSVHVINRNPAYRFLPNRDPSIVAVSEYLRQWLIEHGVPPQRVRTVYNGTDFTEFPTLDPLEQRKVRRELGVPDDALLVGLFGQINAFKGSYLLVQAARRVLECYPSTYFVFVGAVQPQVEADLKALAKGYVERLRFTGTRNDVRRLMAAMDVITLPSRYEACSMAIIEAMAVGKPVVATRAGGNPELVQDGETGLLIERTPEALAEALVEILADTSRRRRMGEAALQVAKARFASSVTAHQIEELYSRLVNSTAAQLSG